MIIRNLTLALALLLAACAANAPDGSPISGEIAALEKQAYAQNDLAALIFLWDSEYFTVKGSNAKVKNPLFNPQKANVAIEVFLRSVNLSRADEFAEIQNPLANPEPRFANVKQNLKKIAEPGEEFYAKLKICGENFCGEYNGIVKEAKADKSFENFQSAKSGFYKSGSTALQRSLYFQGFNPEFCRPAAYENKFGGMDFPPLNMTPSDADMKADASPRDAEKAYKYALLNSTLFDTTNYANLRLNGIGADKNPEAAALLFSKSIFWNLTAAEISALKDKSNLRWESREYFLPLYAYMLYRGLGVKKDAAKCDAILALPIYNECWKNFYCGWLVPKDFDFAIYCLELLNKKFLEEGSAKAAQNAEGRALKPPSELLAEIYAGKFNPKHKDPAKASRWKAESEKQKSRARLSEPPAAKNPHAESALSGEEKAAYYKNPVRHVEALAGKNSLRALELSMYYQGWPAEEIFFRFNSEMSPELQSTPTKSEMPQSPKMRDKPLALKWAEISVEGKDLASSPLEFCNLANLLYSKNPPPKDAEFFGKLYSDFELDIFGDAPFTGSNNYGCGGIYALAFKNACMDFPADIRRCEEILDRSNRLLWRNFYAGFLVPQDRDFAVFILSRSKDFWDMQALADIYKGAYDAGDANPKLAGYWQKKADKAKSAYVSRRAALYNALPIFSPDWSALFEKHQREIKEKNPNAAKKEILDSFNKKYNLFKYGAKQKIIKPPYSALTCDIALSGSNPNYDRKLAEKIVDNLIAEGRAAENIAATFLRENLPCELGVDKDLIDKFYKESAGGIFCPAYKRTLADAPRGLENFKRLNAE